MVAGVIWDECSCVRVGDQLMMAWLFSPPFEWRGFLSLPVHMSMLYAPVAWAGGQSEWWQRLVQ